MLAAIRPALMEIGFEVETTKAKTDKITRPVLFGENGVVLVQYDVDAEDVRIVVELRRRSPRIDSYTVAAARVSV